MNLITWLDNLLGAHTHNWSTWATSAEGNILRAGTKQIAGIVKIQERTCITCNKIEVNKIETIFGE